MVVVGCHFSSWAGTHLGLAWKSELCISQRNLRSSVQLQYFSLAAHYIRSEAEQKLNKLTDKKRIHSLLIYFWLMWNFLVSDLSAFEIRLSIRYSLWFRCSAISVPFDLWPLFSSRELCSDEVMSSKNLVTTFPVSFLWIWQPSAPLVRLQKITDWWV